MINIVLCGGSGTRLWPVSRTLMPKQFVKLFDDRSTFQLTIDRNSKVCNKQFIVSNIDQFFLAVDQLNEIKKENSSCLLEPMGRDTAPAIALACMALPKDELVLVTPSDHLIKKEKNYKEVVLKAKELAKKGHLVTFGIEPLFAETGFGYIESCGEDVLGFHEKPDESTAQKYLDSGGFYWNAGIFCFKAGVYLEELKKHSPEIYTLSEKAFGSVQCIDQKTYKIPEELMAKIPSNSIDYAVMEKSDKVKIVVSDIGWSDLGSFDALYQELPKDNKGNTLNENHISINSNNNFIYGNERKIATVDVDDLIVVDTGDALLISKKGSSQKVKKVVKLIKQDTSLHNIHLTAHRPWGSYTVLEDTPGYKIKRIEVKPGKRLSLQKHFHRSEHWVVVSGTATVTIEDRVQILRPNESTYINMGEVHRLQNEGKIPVVLIEAQVGEYTGEDDIVRLEDDFERR